MKKLFTLFLVAALGFALTGCGDDYDDTALVGRMDDFESRLTALEKQCSQMNSNISALQTVVNALQSNDYIVDVTPITENGETVGYTISFAQHDAITIYNGADGKDGENGADGKDGATPEIGVRQDTDGVYYWTLDGEWLTDANGDKIQASATDGKDGEDGADGKDGADGVTPQLKIEEGHWWISTDNGATWSDLGAASEGGGSGITVTEDDSAVYFTLSDGTVITIAKRASLGMEIEDVEGTVYFMFGETKEFKVNTTGVEKVTFTKPDEWKVSYADGVLSVTAPTAEHSECSELSGDVTVIYTSATNECSMTSVSVAVTFGLSVDSVSAASVTVSVTPAVSGEYNYYFGVIEKSVYADYDSAEAFMAVCLADADAAPWQSPAVGRKLTVEANSEYYLYAFYSAYKDWEEYGYGFTVLAFETPQAAGNPVIEPEVSVSFDDPEDPVATVKWNANASAATVAFYFAEAEDYPLDDVVAWQEIEEALMNYESMMRVDAAEDFVAEYMLSYDVDYVLYAVPFDVAGNAGAMTAVEFSTKTFVAAGNPVIAPEVVDISFDDPDYPSATFVWHANEDAATVAFYPADASSYPLDDVVLWQEMEEALMNYEPMMRVDAKEDFYSEYQLEPDTDYVLYAMPFDAAGNAGSMTAVEFSTKQTGEASAYERYIGTWLLPVVVFSNDPEADDEEGTVLMLNIQKDVDGKSYKVYGWNNDTRVEDIPAIWDYEDGKLIIKQSASLGVHPDYPDYKLGLVGFFNSETIDDWQRLPDKEVLATCSYDSENGMIWVEPSKYTASIYGEEADDWYFRSWYEGIMKQDGTYYISKGQYMLNPEFAEGDLWYMLPNSIMGLQKSTFRKFASGR